ncbi:MarR family transcriptional regulator [Candidatus Poribacteria bacterium]|nr:MarR family transcriptional regulator [Candidatus Poribacteria bacterium]
MQDQDQSSEQPLFSLIKWVSKAFRAKLNHSFTKAGHNVTSEQWRILRCLWHKDGQRQQDLADVARKDKTSITRIIDSMEKRDLVVRVPDRLDRRQNLIYLTNKAKRLQEDLTEIIRKTALQAQQGIDPDDLETLREVLTKLHDNLRN